MMTMIAEGVAFLKVDTEGHELDVLRGAKQLLKQHAIAHMMVELRSFQADEFVKLVYDHAGYACRWAPTAPLPASAHAAPLVYMTRGAFAAEIHAMDGLKDAHCAPRMHVHHESNV